MNAIEVHHRGLASGMLGMLRQVGSAVGLAVASAIVNASSHLGNTAPTTRAGKNALAHAINYSMAWTAFVVIVMWFIAFSRTRDKPGCLT